MVVAGDKNDFSVRNQFFQAHRKFQPGGRRHLDIRKNHVRTKVLGFDCLQCVRAQRKIHDFLLRSCFGYFEVFRQGEPLVFARNKTRELFAFLVDRRGAAVSSEEAATVLYEDADPESMKKARQNIRNLISDMKNTLNGVGMGDVLIRKGTSLALRIDLLDCDYLRMLQGDMEAVNSFRGEYMEQYSWAELTKGSLAFDRNAAKQASL